MDSECLLELEVLAVKEELVCQVWVANNHAVLLLAPSRSVLKKWKQFSVSNSLDSPKIVPQKPIFHVIKTKKWRPISYSSLELTMMMLKCKQLWQHRPKLKLNQLSAVMLSPNLTHLLRHRQTLPLPRLKHSQNNPLQSNNSPPPSSSSSLSNPLLTMEVMHQWMVTTITVETAMVVLERAELEMEVNVAPSSEHTLTNLTISLPLDGPAHKKKDMKEKERLDIKSESDKLSKQL